MTATHTRRRPRAKRQTKRPRTPRKHLDAARGMDRSASTAPLVALQRGLAAALYYIASSVSLTLFNKLLFQRHEMTSPVLVLCAQAALTLVILTGLSFFGVAATFDPRRLTRTQRSSHFGLFLSYILMLLFGLAALQHTSLLMYHTLRRTSIVAVLLAQWILLGLLPSRATLAATALIVSGAFAAVATNLRFELAAYVLAGAANIATAVYLVRLKDVRDYCNVSNLQLLFINNVYALPALLAVLIASPPEAAVWARFAIPEFTFLFLASASFALVLNHAVYVNTTVNDAVAHTISTQIKDVVLLAISIIFVDDAKLRSRGMLDGALVAFAGSLVYALGKLREKFGSKAVEIKDDVVREPLVSNGDDDGEEREVGR